MTYTEAEKNLARSTTLEAAVTLLTKRRHEMPLVPESYLRDVRDHLINAGGYDREVAEELSDETIERWEQFYRASLGTKLPSQLRVAYLAGPNPENDLRELTKLGVLPEHVWAFESDTNVYNDAITATLNSEFPFLKLFKGKIDVFAESIPIKFDLVYLDFCGPIPSRVSGTLHSLFLCLSKHVLSSPGIMLINSAFVEKGQDEVGWSHLTRLMACYLFSKGFLEHEDTSGDHSMIEGAECYGETIETFLEKIQGNPQAYYSQFVTRLIIDLAGVICPYQRVASSKNLWGLFSAIPINQFSEKHVDRMLHANEHGDGGEVLWDKDAYPLLWTFASLCQKLNGKDGSYPQFIYSDDQFKNYAEMFLRQILENQDINFMRKGFIPSALLLTENQEINTDLSTKLKNMSEQKWWTKFYQFCDLVLFHQIKEVLFRQLAVPYHSNLKQLKRWSYRAKKTQMFLDMHVLDECRYLYDWMPTIDLFGSGFDDMQRQLSFRFIQDGIQKHTRWMNPELFSGTAVVDQFEPGFEAIHPQSREEIPHASEC